MKNLKSKLYKILRRSEKYTKTDMVYLARGGFWLSLGKIVGTIASFLSALAFANLLPKEIYGTYKYILTLLGTLAIFTLPGMNTAIVQAVARGYEGSFYQAFKTKLKWGCLGSLTAIILGLYYWYQGNIVLPIPLFLCAVFLPLMETSQIYISLLGGKKLFSYQVKYSAISRILSVTAMIAVLFLTDNLIWIITVYFISNTLINTFFYFFTKFKFRPNKKEDPQTLSYGKHLTLMSVIGIIAGNLDKILLWHFFGAAQLAIFSFAYAPVNNITKTFSSLKVLVLPKLSQRSIPELKQSAPGKALRFLIILVPIAIIYIFIAPYIYRYFFPQYQSSVIYSQALAFTILFPAIIPLTEIFKAHKRTKELYLFSTINPIFKIILLILLIPPFGIWGLIITRLAQWILEIIIVVIFFKEL